MSDANSENISVSVDPLNVMTFDIPPLDEKLLKNIERGRLTRTRILDGSQLEQHEEKKPYAETHVDMHFGKEDDIIRCVRLLQWSDERMRSRRDVTILWAWREAFREKSHVYFSVLWYTKEFFESRKDSFSDESHQSYYEKFGMNPNDLQIRHEIF